VAPDLQIECGESKKTLANALAEGGHMFDVCRRSRATQRSLKGLMCSVEHVSPAEYAVASLAKRSGASG